VATDTLKVPGAVRPRAGRYFVPLVTGAAFLLLNREPLVTLVRDWWNDPEAGHGLLLGPLALVLAWRKGLVSDARGQPWLGLAILTGSVLLRYLSGLAAELYTMRLSMLGAAAGLIVFGLGFRQLLRWWLPALLLLLSVPLPAMVLNALAFPLQLKASAIGTALLEWRHVPVITTGNVIHLPGHSLFVTEACSGLRSLTALISLAVLIGGLWLRTPVGRLVLAALVIPVGIVLNGIRVFLTGFLVAFVDPALADGFMHLSEGWALFVVAFGVMGVMAWGLNALERIRPRWRREHESWHGHRPA